MNQGRQHPYRHPHEHRHDERRREHEHRRERRSDESGLVGYGGYTGFDEGTRRGFPHTMEGAAYSSGDLTAREGPGYSDYDYTYAGSQGDWDQNEYGGDQYGGGRYGQGPYEQSQQYGGSGFSSGTGDFGSLQRQYENRFVSGGHRGSYGDRFGYSGPGDYSSKQTASEGRPWGERYSTASDVGTRRFDEGAYYGALDYYDEAGRGAYGENPYGYYGQYAPGGGYSGSAGGGYSSADFAVPRMRGSARRGPKGYTRSDERIQEEVCERLTHAPEYVDVSDVSVAVQNGAVTLEGTVINRHMKHRIEDIVDQCSGVQDIDNRIRVRRPEEQPVENQQAIAQTAQYSSEGS